MMQNRRPATAVGITIALFPPLTAADLYLSADRSGILPVNATVFSFLSLSLPSVLSCSSALVVTAAAVSA